MALLPVILILSKMLAGIKIGKKKKRKQPPPSNETIVEGDAKEAEKPDRSFESSNDLGLSNEQQKLPKSERTRNVNHSQWQPTTMISHKSNESIADQLRVSLASGSIIPSDVKHQKNSGTRDDAVIVTSSAAILPAVAAAAKKPETEQTIADMVTLEKAQESSLADEEIRNVMRLSKRQRQAKKYMNATDSDEEEAYLTRTAMPAGQDAVKSAQRYQHRQISIHDKQEKIISKCWWWLESTSFSRHRLLALGDHVSLVMAPFNLSLTPGHHFYIVPIAHAESLTAVEDDRAWEEIRNFQSALRNLYQLQGKGLLFTETVLPTTSSFWQTKLEAIPVPLDQWHDAPLFFKSALAEQAQEWGTHQKLMHTTAAKGLRRTVPKNFSYFYLEYSNNGDGFAHMIESPSLSSSSGRVFPKDFAANTIAGMLKLDPIRFRRKERSNDAAEKQAIHEFLEKWKPFDWTLQLDG